MLKHPIWKRKLKSTMTRKNTIINAGNTLATTAIITMWLMMTSHLDDPEQHKHTDNSHHEYGEDCMGADMAIRHAIDNYIFAYAQTGNSSAFRQLFSTSPRWKRLTYLTLTSLRRVICIYATLLVSRPQKQVSSTKWELL